MAKAWLLHWVCGCSLHFIFLTLHFGCSISMEFFFSFSISNNLYQLFLSSIVKGWFIRIGLKPLYGTFTTEWVLMSISYNRSKMEVYTSQKAKYKRDYQNFDVLAALSCIFSLLRVVNLGSFSSNIVTRIVSVALRIVLRDHVLGNPSK